jgi:hypothetical protein
MVNLLNFREKGVADSLLRESGRILLEKVLELEPLFSLELLADNVALDKAIFFFILLV